jgi:hypothetical protein
LSQQEYVTKETSPYTFQIMKLCIYV